MARLRRKWDTARTLVPAPVVDRGDGAEVGLIAFGTTDACVIEARDRLSEQGLDTSYLRIRALPLNDTTRDFIASHERVYVVENNSDGQMASILHMEYPELAPRIHSIAYADGLPLSPRWLTGAVLEQEGR